MHYPLEFLLKAYQRQLTTIANSSKYVNMLGHDLFQYSSVLKYF